MTEDFLPPTLRDPAWAKIRSEREAGRGAVGPMGKGRARRFRGTALALRLLSFGLRCLRLERAAARSVLKIRLVEADAKIRGLDPAFEGVRILHVTDPHLDAHPDLAEAVASAIRSSPPVDFCVFTGDYRFGGSGPHETALEGMERMCAAAASVSSSGIFAVLGNHDSAAMADDLELFGAKTLQNESKIVALRGRTVLVCGLDDVHRFWTPSADAALSAAAEVPADFRLAIVHSQGPSGLAASLGFDLYLCGHTHGGQIALPFGIPLLTHSDAGWWRTFGFWRAADMLGRTSSGAGFSGLAIRLFTRSEVVVLTLKRA